MSDLRRKRVMIGAVLALVSTLVIAQPSSAPAAGSVPFGKIAVGGANGTILVLAAVSGHVLARVPERGVFDVDLSADGRWIAYPTYPSPAGLVVQPVAGGQKRVVARCGSKWCPNWPAWRGGRFGDELAYELGEVIYRVGENGLGRQRVTRGEAPDWSPNTPEITFMRDFSLATNAGKVYIAAEDGFDVRYITRGAYPAFHPGGGQLAYVLGRDIFVVSVDGGKPRRVIKNGGAPVWSPDGRYLAFTRTTSCPDGGHGPCSGRIFVAAVNRYASARPLGPEITDIGRISWSR